MLAVAIPQLSEIPEIGRRVDNSCGSEFIRDRFVRLAYLCRLFRFSRMNSLPHFVETYGTQDHL
jgi:hypothetical protein